MLYFIGMLITFVFILGAMLTGDISRTDLEQPDNLAEVFDEVPRTIFLFVGTLLWQVALPLICIGYIVTNWDEIVGKLKSDT